MPDAAEALKTTKLENAIIGLEDPPWSGLYRVVIGLMIVPVLSLFGGQARSGWMLTALLLGALLGLRIFPLAVRRLITFSEAAKGIWAERRQLAKHYDSYQWKKLFWIGLGMAPHTGFEAFAGDAPASWIAVSSTCLAAGAAGMVRWRKVNPLQ